MSHEKIFAIGLERCGTHTLTKAIQSITEKEFIHEKQPYLCQEALLKFNELEYKNKNYYDKIKWWEQEHVYGEANHRLLFIIDELYKNFECKFILSIRDPVQMLISRVLRGCIHLSAIKYLPYNIPIDKHEFNIYRIWKDQGSLPEQYLFELIETLKYLERMLDIIPREKLLILHVEEFGNSGSKILKFLNKEGNIDDIMKRKYDSVSDSIFRNDIELLFKPYNKLIQEEYSNHIKFLCK